MSTIKRTKDRKWRWLWIAVAIAVAAAGGGYGYFEYTRVDRTLAEVQDLRHFNRKISEWWNLAKNREARGVQDAFRRLLADTKAWERSNWKVRYGRERIEVLDAGLMADVPIRDENLLRDLVVVFLRFGTNAHESAVEGGYDFSLLGRLIPDIEMNPVVTQIGLDYAAEFMVDDKLRRADLDDRDHIFRVLLELDRRGASADDRYLVAAARAIFLSTISPEDLGFGNLKKVLTAARDKQGLSNALAEAMIWSAGNELRVSREKLTLILEPLLSQPPTIDSDDYLAAIVYQCAFWRATECARLADRVGADAPERLHQLKPLHDPEMEKNLAIGLADEVVNLRAGGKPSAIDILKSVAVLLPPHDSWTAFQQGPPRSRIVSETPAGPLIDRAFEQLMQMGPEIHPTLYRCLDVGNRVLVSICARILAKKDRAAFVAALGERLTSLEPHARAFAARMQFDARQFFDSGTAVAEGLRALASLDDPPFNHELFFQALSSPDPEFSKYAARVLRGRLGQDEYIDSLFSYLAMRNSFSVDEMGVYRKTLVSFSDGSEAVERNLQRLLDETGGQADQVFWIHKVLGLQALAVIGRSSALPLLEQYGKDSTAYVEKRIRTVNGETTAISEKIPFSDLTASAIEAIRKREE